MRPPRRWAFSRPARPASRTTRRRRGDYSLNSYRHTRGRRFCHCRPRRHRAVDRRHRRDHGPGRDRPGEQSRRRTTTARRPSRPGWRRPATASSWSIRARRRRATSRCGPPKAARPLNCSDLSRRANRKPVPNTGSGGRLFAHQRRPPHVRSRQRLQLADPAADGAARRRLRGDRRGGRADRRRSGPRHLCPRRDRHAAANARRRRNAARRRKRPAASRPSRTKSTSTWSKRSRT